MDRERTGLRSPGGRTERRAAANNPSLNLESVHPNYFATFGVRLTHGRTFTPADRQGSPNVAIISQDLAARTWPGTDPIGRRLKMGGPDAPAQWLTIVGVAAQTRYRDLVKPLPTLYLPAAQFQMTADMLVVRTASSVEFVTSTARELVQAVDPDVHVVRVAPFTQMRDVPLARPRFNAFLLAVFGIVALVLSAIGLYGVMAAYVRRRHHEIAVRMALGATATTVHRLVLAESLRLAGVGALIGVATAATTTRLLREALFEIQPLDPSTISGAALLLMAASAVASYIPLRRATRVDAAAILRSE